MVFDKCKIRVLNSAWSQAYLLEHMYLALPTAPDEQVSLGLAGVRKDS